MTSLGLDREVIDRETYRRTIGAFRAAGILLPTFAQLAAPATLPAATLAALSATRADEADPRNLFRVHWHNDRERTGQAAVPVHVILPNELTGVDAKIVVAPGDLFPMIRAHKVLSAYACLAPRVITGAFDPTRDRAVWPSTGNYCRGGVAISRLMGCRGVAVLPEGMSRERFAWLQDWVTDPGDIIRTPGTESNVKEIYDKCAELSADPGNVIFNQFAEFGNHLAGYQCTGRAMAAVFESMTEAEPGLRLRAFAATSGSAGTLAAGDYLKERYGAKIAAAEALECPTMLANGFGAHNIQGIGDKHIPLIHNVMNTDLVVGISDRATDQLSVLFADAGGLEYLRVRRRVPEPVLAFLPAFGLSSVANILAAVKVAKYLRLGPDDVVMTVATDGAAMYGSERERISARDFPAGFGMLDAAEVFGRWMLGLGTDDLLETTLADRDRIFNLGYYTWVEQQGVSLADFEARRDQRFWTGLRDLLPAWDAMITEFNERTGLAPG
ncbi:MAG TPA: pyridoxal-phosphate dependent enzyme [Streptosporangiaceae bacterium]